MHLKDFLSPTVAKLFLTVIFISDSALSGATPLQRPVRDTVYLQESGRKLVSAKALTSLAVFKDKLYVASADGVALLENGQLIYNPDFNAPVIRLIATSETLWAIGNPGLYRWQNNQWQEVSKERISDLTEHNGSIIVSLGRKLASPTFTIREDRDFFST